MENGYLKFKYTTVVRLWGDVVGAHEEYEIECSEYFYPKSI